MTSQYRHRRTSNPATVFTNPLEPGEIAVNTANRQIAVGDAASATLGTPKPLVAIRYFDTAAQYVLNDFVVNGTSLYRANKPTGPGVFVTADWVMMVGQVDPQYVEVAGDVMTGALSLPATPPVAPVHATNKAYVDNLVALKSSVIVSDVKPSPDPIDSTLWYCTLDGQLYIRFNDGNTTQWVIAAPQPDSSNYVSLIGSSAVRYDVSQALTEPQKVQARQNVYAAPFDAMAYNGMQFNGSFEISQEKGGTAIVGPGYICDGWYLATSIPTYTAGVGGAGPFPGINGYLGALPTVAIPSVAASDYLSVFQNIEGYRVGRLRWGTAGAIPLTVGFWTSHYKPGLYSIAVQNAAGDRSCTATYTHAVGGVAQYNVLTIPGCTDGSWNTGPGIGLRLMLSILHGTTFTAPAAGVWYNTNYGAAPGCVAPIATADQIYFSGVVVLPGIEAPSAARSPLIMRPYDQELILCQRYYEKSYDYGTAPGATGNRPGFVVMYLASTASMTNLAATVSFKTRKRALPAVTSYAPGSGLAGKVADFGNAVDVAAALAGISDNGFYNNPATSVAVPALNMGFHWVADARL